MPDVVHQSAITCPECGHMKLETMPTDACQYFYDCTGCGAVLKPKQGTAVCSAHMGRCGARPCKLAQVAALRLIPPRPLSVAAAPSDVMLSPSARVFLEKRARRIGKALKRVGAAVGVGPPPSGRIGAFTTAPAWPVLSEIFTLDEARKSGHIGQPLDMAVLFPRCPVGNIDSLLDRRTENSAISMA